jgi:hypothetical protein
MSYGSNIVDVYRQQGGAEPQDREALGHAGCSVRNLCRARRVSSAEPSSQETNFEASTEGS